MQKPWRWYCRYFTVFLLFVCEEKLTQCSSTFVNVLRTPQCFSCELNVLKTSKESTSRSPSTSSKKWPRSFLCAGIPEPLSRLHRYFAPGRLTNSILIHVYFSPQKCVPIFLGSSLKNLGVQPLMDGIVSYLPSPLDLGRSYRDLYDDDLCGFSFKSCYDAHKGYLTFLRLYSGSITPVRDQKKIKQE